MKTLFLVILISLAHVHAQTFEDDPSRPVLGKTGQIFALKFIPGSKRLEIALVGSPTVTLDPDRLTVLGKVYPTKGQPKTLAVRAADHHFEILDNIDNSSAVEFEVKDRLTKKTETLKL